MKALLSFLLILSLALNAILLTGCASVSAHRLWTPPPVSSADMAEIVKALPDAPRETLVRGQNWLVGAQGKIVILLDDTEENRTAKRMVINFVDEN